METRRAKLIVGSAGGNASRSAKTYKISIPSKWVKELSLDKRNIRLEFDGTSICIKPEESLQEFIKNKKQLGHRLVKIQVFNEDELCSIICADLNDETIKCENYNDDYIKTPFGNNYNPDYSDYIDFLKERCIPETREGIKEYLDAISVAEFDPLEIIKKTDGVMAEDNIHLVTEEI